jgi:Plasmid encoded RepA protein
VRSTYGQDRLIPIWLATLALQQKNRMVQFENPAQLLDYFRLRKDGSQYRRIKTAFQRVFAATIFFGSEEHLKKTPLVDWSRFHFADQMRLWFNREDRPQPSAQQDPGNMVVLSEAFYREICEHPIPVEREVVAALAHAPGLLDFYVWITWKSWTLKDQPAYVLFFGPSGLCNQLGTTQYSVDRLFRHKVAHWLNQVKQFWPACPASISPEGRCLTIRSSKTSAAVAPLKRVANV